MASNSGQPLHAVDDEECQTVATKIQPLPLLHPASSFPTKNWTVDQENKGKLPPTLTDVLGLDEFLTLDVYRASVGELLGTAVLVFMLDTIVISTIESDIKMPNLVLSVLAAVIITILLLAVHPVSGGHINPIISFSAALVGLISMSRALVYIVAQCAGAILGALALKAVVSSAIEQNFSLGGCTITVVAPGPDGPITIGLETAQAFWLEIICSFIFLFASIWMAYDHRQAKQLGHVLVFSIVGVVLGLLVFVSSTVTAQKGYVGAGLNPARCIGPAIVRGGHLWDGHWCSGLGLLLLACCSTCTQRSFLDSTTGPKPMIMISTTLLRSCLELSEKRMRVCRTFSAHTSLHLYASMSNML
ncbi:UNVERIFIED_CONTAM: Aquaporin PIP-type [Sesamum angustifolium]|uniref:Aquaporin PIP-type n=1 Tax=Sesamum angustifolium TaxID=2727405 RepID=A0AAW2NYX2_9LAMI